LIVTEPTYSRTGFQQTIVPVLDDSFEPGDLDVMISPGSRLIRLGDSYARGMFAPTMIMTVYQPDHIARYLGIVIEAELMAKLETALVAHFGL
jgi:hypothetical protein